MYIKRIISDKIIDKLSKTNKVIVIYGARQTGKTTLSKQILNQLNLKSLYVNADQMKYHDVFSSKDVNKIRSVVMGYDLILIDEAQRIPDIGINLKIIHDEIPEIKLLVTGSSSLDLASKVTEPLTGRKQVFPLYPIAISELKSLYNNFEINDKLEELLIYGSYPEVFTTINHNEKKDILEEISSSYLFKDIFELLNLRYRNKIYDLLRMLAFQVGSEVSVHELSNSLKINRETVENYLNLLEQSFIIFKIRGFSKNLRKEVSKMNKYFFYDLGIRNYLINNFNPLKLRNDLGQLWENFLFIERKKYLEYNKISTNQYFWRTYTGTELDYVEERNGILTGYEFKLKKTRKQPPKTWLETYNADYKFINRENYLEFIV